MKADDILAKSAYDAYRRGIEFSGYPEFHELEERERDAWQMVVDELANSKKEK